MLPHVIVMTYCVQELGMPLAMVLSNRILGSLDGSLLRSSQALFPVTAVPSFSVIATIGEYYKASCCQIHVIVSGYNVNADRTLSGPLSYGLGTSE
jgi:hypothetical protein